MSVVGAKPRITAPQFGSAIAIWTPKQIAMTPSSVTMKASIQRKPRFCIHRIRNTSSAVIRTPSSSGMPNRRLSPIAVPITSARSVAQIAISAIAHSGHDTARGNASRQACARSRPDAIPSRAHSACKQDRHQVGEQRNGEQRVPELRPARERGRPIARVHVADGDEIAGSEKGRELLPQRPLRPRGDRAEDFRRAKARPAAVASRIRKSLERVIALPALVRRPSTSILRPLHNLVANNLQLHSHPLNPVSLPKS